MTVCPGFRLPSRSAASMIDNARRSLTEPPGLAASSLTNISTPSGAMELIRMTGVLPIVSSIEVLMVIPVLPPELSRRRNIVENSFRAGAPASGRRSATAAVRRGVSSRGSSFLRSFRSSEPAEGRLRLPLGQTDIAAEPVVQVSGVVAAGRELASQGNQCGSHGPCPSHW